jgi:hypothetical protein
MGNRFFSKVQYGKESTRGTAVAATKILLGKVPAINSDRKPVIPDEDIGIRARGVRSVIHQYLYSNTLSTEHGYFQQLPWLFGCGLKGGVTPGEVTAGQGDMLWTQTPSLVAGVLNEPDSSTIELGDDTQAFEAEYAMFERIRISGQVAQGMDAAPVNIEADFFSRQLTPTTFTGALSLPVAEPMNAKLARLYVDSAWSGIGGTELANVLRSFDIEIITGVHPKFSGSGDKYFNAHGEGLITVTAQFTIEGLSAANALFNAQQAATFQAVRLEIDGGVIGTGTPHSLKLDIGGVWESVSPLGGEDRSDNLHTATLVDQYDSTGAKLLQVATVTNVSSY